MADVARRARVSTATVSRVLAGVGSVRPETRARIVAAAEALDYRPSAVARSLRQGTTRSLGLIITDIENPFFPQLVRAIEDAASRAGYALLLCNAADDPEREAGYLELLAERRVDGVILAVSRLGGRHREWLAQPPVPVVLVNAAARGVRVPTVASDDRTGGRLAAEHLLRLGHQRLAALTVGPRHAAAPARLAGVRHVIAAAGVPERHLDVVVDQPDVGGGERAADEALDRDPRPTAIIAHNDLMAIGALRAARSRGLHVPGRLSIVGFDDIPIAAYAEPPLTTVAQDVAALGSWAVERLVERLTPAAPIDREGEAAASSEVRSWATTGRVVVPVRLVIRGSTGRAPEGPG
ncbi:MAG TPA: LacI family DNA-binding transcriptional regulator [Candidatus Saccharimonadales bacterium]|nr:LacI family DNA-binding transcriptional regulator [Candidatus Saccharimonadales bacterium]